MMSILRAPGACLYGKSVRSWTIKRGNALLCKSTTDLRVDFAVFPALGVKRKIGELRPPLTHDAIFALVDLLPSYQGCSGFKQDEQIETKALMINVPDIQGQFLSIRKPCSAIDLGPTGETGPNPAP